MTRKEAGWACGGSKSLENDHYLKGARGFLASRGGYFFSPLAKSTPCFGDYHHQNGLSGAEKHLQELRRMVS